MDQVPVILKTIFGDLYELSAPLRYERLRQRNRESISDGLGQSEDIIKKAKCLLTPNIKTYRDLQIALLQYGYAMMSSSEQIHPESLHKKLQDLYAKTLNLLELYMKAYPERADLKELYDIEIERESERKIDRQRFDREIRERDRETEREREINRQRFDREIREIERERKNKISKEPAPRKKKPGPPALSLDGEIGSG